MTYDEFVSLEERNRDIITINKLYIDILEGDLISGLLLSQIVYWNLPSKQSGLKRSAEYLVKLRRDWYDEIRITPKQYDRAAAVLQKAGLIDWKIQCSNYYGGKTAPHIALKTDILMQKINTYLAKSELPKGENGTTELPKGENRNTPKVNSSITERSNPSITEITNKDYIQVCATAEIIPLTILNKTALHTKIRSDFEAADHEYYHDGREAAAINELIKRALFSVGYLPEDQKYQAAYAIIREKAAILYRLINNPPSDFFARLTFLPHVLQIVWNEMKPEILTAKKKTKFEQSITPDIMKKLMEA